MTENKFLFDSGTFLNSKWKSYFHWDHGKKSFAPAGQVVTRLGVTHLIRMQSFLKN